MHYNMLVPPLHERQRDRFATAMRLTPWTTRRQAIHNGAAPNNTEDASPQVQTSSSTISHMIHTYLKSQRAATSPSTRSFTRWK
mmetsp:Transcript_5428/g.11968  ORF Transcript_5428/g.11968 Transcript_5428/m.11968 type:complete len:84 (-) Transcript_5428:1691-1942(-)